MKKGMIKVSVLYPNGDGNKFDMDYYLEKHVPMVSKLLGDTVKSVTVEQGLGGAEPGSPAAFLTMANMYFNTMDDFANSFGPNAGTIMGDLPNFTNTQPTVQISKVLM
jgi:uncharacterized protein (TIGR02118 family)